MDKDLKELLYGVGFFAAIAATATCGIGLLVMGYDGSISATHFIRLGMSTAGAAMVGAVVGLFSIADDETARVEDKTAEKQSV